MIFSARGDGRSSADQQRGKTMFNFSRNAARYFAAAAATLFLISCGGSDDTPAPPPFGATTHGHWVQRERQRKSVPSTAIRVSADAAGLQPAGFEWTAVGHYRGSALRRHCEPVTQGRHQFRLCRCSYWGRSERWHDDAPPAPIAPSLVQQTETLLARHGYNDQSAESGHRRRHRRLATTSQDALGHDASESRERNGDLPPRR